MQRFDNYSTDSGLYSEAGDYSGGTLTPLENTSRRTRRSSQDREQTRKRESRPSTDSRNSTRSNTTKTPQNSKKQDTQQETKSSVPQRIKDIITSPTARCLTGIFLIILAAFLTISIISYVHDNLTDQVNIQTQALGQAKVHNLGGEAGARLTNLLVNESFGIASLVIVFWMVMLALKLLTNSRFVRFKTINFTIKCLIALITTSLIIGLLTIGFDTPFNLGGAHGRYINQLIIDFIGWAGAGLLSLFMLILFVMICLNDIVQWFLRKKKERNQRRAAEEAQRQAEEERKRKLRNMKRQDIIDDTLTGEHHDATSATPDTDTLIQEQDNVDFTQNPDTSDDNCEYTMPEEDDITYIYDNTSDEEYPDEDNTDLIEDTDNTSDEDTISDKNVDDTDTNNTTKPMRVNLNQIAVLQDDVKPNPIDPRNELPDYHFPPIGLLREGNSKVNLNDEEQLENQARIRKTLQDFGIGITHIEATVGPTVTLYEIVPQDGIKINRIRNLAEDIARSLAATGVRIIAPMPGKGTVGIEVANKEPQVVSMRTIIASRKYRECKYALPLAIGSTISNEVYIADLTKMPHLLVAGATGQGKSVGLNAIIASLLYRRHPSELKFVLFDPKMVELSLYSMLEKHYLAKLPDEEEPIITDMNKVMPALSSLCLEMDGRYELLKAARVRTIKEYNERYLSGRLSPHEGHRYMPYIVVIVDEYSDLKMTAGKEIEKPIARLAQKARAVGIHLIIATQRPSTDVVTGMIKANFPARIAFKVSSGVDSKTILNSTGAFQLIGNGDMLISNGSDLVRVQCAFIDTPEVEDICSFISQQPGFENAYLLPEPIVNGEGEEIFTEGLDTTLDPLLERVAREIVNMDTASTSAIQRRHSIGYNRAGKIMDQLERLGVVGPSHGGKPRTVLTDPVTLESILASLNK